MEHRQIENWQGKTWPIAPSWTALKLNADLYRKNPSSGTSIINTDVFNALYVLLNSPRVEFSKGEGWSISRRLECWSLAFYLGKILSCT
jgi:hypothetical protein